MPVVRRLLPAAPPPPPAPLLWRDEMPPEVVRDHDEAGPAPAVDLHALRGARFGGRGLAARRGRVRTDSGLVPPFVPWILESKGINSPYAATWLGGLLDEASEEVASSHPVLMPVHPLWVFGHALLDMMPRAMLLDEICPPAWPIAVASDGPAWLPDLIALTVPRRPLLRYRAADQVVTAPAFVGTSDLCMPTFLRPELRTLFDLLKARLLARESLRPRVLSQLAKEGAAPEAPAGDLLYVSRVGARSAIHHIADEAALEEALAARGWRVLRPETVPFPEQVRAFDAARVVLGEYGSGMHNAVFSRPGTTVVCLNRLNGYQSRIASAFGHRIGYLAPAGGFRDGPRLFATGESALAFDLPALLERLRPLEQGEAAS